ncbi:hypothetical protein [Microvirga lotononidis]|nr:hypothetical protein [Microvirga lotononidis]WQO27277.1 hypothetical protein U0023_21940 [Microvirga lotononidis]
MLVYGEQERLLAVLTHLSADNEVAPDHWYLEAGFGLASGKDHPIFVDLDAALAWLRQCTSHQAPPGRGRPKALHSLG